MYNIIVETVPIERFVYRPIDLTRKSIRLLRIIRGDCGLIKCELFDAWLEDDGGIIEYEALSYTWGGSEKLHMVIINDKPFQVTANLSQALQDLRNPDKDRILWIDAICIDQDNDPERGHQVQQMSLIYKRADRVIVWLGPSSSSTGRAFDHMQRLEEKAADYAYNNWTTSDERWLEIWNKLHSDMAIEPSSILPFIRSDLASLLRRPWFERVWIIQEVANAKSGRVVCGDRSVSIRIFAVFPTLMDIALDVQCQSIIDVMPGSTRKYSWWAKKHDLHTLLVKFRGSKASDPRDKIYALLGISSDISGMDTLTADYEKSLQEIIHDTAFYLLGLDGNQRPLLPLPNWTMDDFLQDVESLDGRLLLWASKHGLEVLWNYLMEIRKADVDFGDEQYRDLLFYTLDANQPNIVKKLLENENIDINLPNRYGTTPLLQAKSQGHHDSVKHLLDTGRLREDSQTLLMIAVSIGSEEHVSLLLDRDDIDIDAEDTDGQTALTLAAKYGFKEIVECLLDKGNADVETTDRWRWSPLWTAAMSMHHDIVDAIFERLKERRGSDLEKERELTTLLSKVGLSSMIPHRERTPLWWAVLNGHDRIVDLLVRVGKVDLQGEDTSGRSLLLWLAGNGCSAAAFNAQLDLNSKEDAKDSRPSRTGEMIRIAETSLRNVRRQRFSTRSPVMQQVSAGHQAILEMLLATSLCNVNARDEFGRTPLCIAALNGNTAMTRILLNVDGVDVDARDGFQITPFLHAVSTGSCAVVRLLVKTRKVDLESHHTGLATARQLTRRKAMIKLLDNCALVY